MLVAEKKITVEEFRHMDLGGDDAYYELINGEIVMKAAPSPLHQEVSNNLSFLLTAFVRDKKLGKVFTSPIDVYLHEFSHVMPDVLFISNENKGIIDYREGIHGVPDLVVEIISPSSIYQDRVMKRNDYEASGVREYWLIDPKNQSIEVYELANGTFQLVVIAAEKGKVHSKLLEGFELDITTIFPSEQ